ncbi:Membrane-associated phospholipid phosphatase [Methanosarcina horonobensis HB-1 = JCM 15518]|uniref:Membrane-associated phospholipid phosphatase n=1 Tax=Methanosarcina horonobensis HB-1 = JCM 15518 TaxID=1434110 RepID=A0A0E3SGA1_9EURY|nr:phosphatase PAP2 family protein [Methanosarcina horonobensis]AKB79352.1 Membrane-associated phospholipid phosphatase [Methanosarcina horonobensis HB-1 = JCM 15518]
MFQTEPILYLQSIGTGWFTFLMVMTTSMGSAAFFAGIVIATAFGIDFKKGFLLFQLLLWTALFTEVFKALIAFPRPDFVDSRVLNLEAGTKNTSPFNGNGEAGFFKLPDREILEAFRLQKVFPDSPFGFPSGHVALTTALWGGISRVFNSRTVSRLTPAAVLLMAFSRMYLGRHFLGDVIGGAILGLILLFTFSRLLKSPFKEDFFKKENFELAFRQKNFFFYFAMFAVPILLASLSLISGEVAGFFFGTNTAYLIIIRKGLPKDTGSTEKRALRVFITLILFGLSTFVLDAGFDIIGKVGYPETTYVEFLKVFIPASTIWISISICTKLDLYGMTCTEEMK